MTATAPTASLRVLCLHTDSDDSNNDLEARLAPPLWHRHGVDLVHVQGPHSSASSAPRRRRIWYDDNQAAPAGQPSQGGVDTDLDKDDPLLQASLYWLHQIWTSPCASEDAALPFAGLVAVGHEAAVAAQAFVASFDNEPSKTFLNSKEGKNQDDIDSEEEDDAADPAHPSNATTLLSWIPPPAFAIFADDDDHHEVNSRGAQVEENKTDSIGPRCEYLRVGRSCSKAIATAEREKEVPTSPRSASHEDNDKEGLSAQHTGSLLTSRTKGLSTAQLNTMGRFLVQQKKKLCPPPRQLQSTTDQVDDDSSSSLALLQAQKTAAVALRRQQVIHLEQEASRYFCDAVQAQPPTALMAVINQPQSLVAGWKDRSMKQQEDDAPSTSATATTSTDLTTTRSSVDGDDDEAKGKGDEHWYPHRPRPPGGGAPCPPVLTPHSHDTAATTISLDEVMSSELSASLGQKLRLGPEE